LITRAFAAMVVAMPNRRIVLASAWIYLMIAAGSQARSAQPDIYPAPEQASADIAAALKSAATSHKRVILDFGGNWCTDCHVLDLYFHDAANRPLLTANYVLVHVNIGRMDANVDVAARYQIPLTKGVPAVAYWMKGASCSTARRRANSRPCAICRPAP
jgi:thiol:disulfide interchange protein